MEMFGELVLEEVMDPLKGGLWNDDGDAN